MLRKFKNNAASTLAAPLAELDTTLTVTGTHGDRFPAVAAPNYFNLTLVDASGNIEIVKVTARTAGQDFMTVERGQEGTSALNWLIGTIVSARLTAGAIEALATQADAETLTNKTMGAGCAWGGSPVPVANGGTGAADAAGARANLGAQTADALLASLALLGTAADKMFYTTGVDTVAETPLTAFARSLLAGVDAAALRTVLGLSSLATNPVALTAYGEQIMALADAAAGRTLLGAAAEASWQTVWVPAPAMFPRLTNGASVGAYESTVNGLTVKTLNFPGDGSTALAQFTVRMPKGWNEGTVKARFLWSHPAGATSFDVVWFLRAVALSDGDAIDAAFGTVQWAIDTGGIAGTLYQTAETPAITIGGTPAEGDLVVFDVYRESWNGSDTLDVTARLHGIVLMYQTSTLNDA